MRIRLLATAAIVSAWTAVGGSANAADLAPLTHVDTFPRNRELSGEGADSNSAQGIAFDGTHWFYATQWRLYRLSATFRDADRVVNVFRLAMDRTHTCAHIGGIDVHAAEVFVALQECTDHKGRIAVFDTNLRLQRSATLADAGGRSLGASPWVAINPRDPEVFYTETTSRPEFSIFPRRFANGAVLRQVGTVSVDRHPRAVLPSYRRQGGAFTPNGLFFLTADDADTEGSRHTGIWAYQLQRTRARDERATRVLLHNIRYDADLDYAFDASRGHELEDLAIASVTSGPLAGEIHLLRVHQEPDENDVSVVHFASGDVDRDGVRDTIDNCIWASNADQRDRNGDGRGAACDPGDALRPPPGTVRPATPPVR